MITKEKSGKKSILLHSCCGPCSTAVIERLAPDFDICVFYYNPNITDAAEYEHRKAEQIRFLSESPFRIDFLEGEYKPACFFDCVRGFEGCKEGGERCRLCFELRLAETARRAKELGFDFFDTTLSVSPYKNSKLIAEVGSQMAEKYGASYFGGNYKKKDGYKRSIELSKEYELYRQHFCGCVFSYEDAKRQGDL